MLIEDGFLPREHDGRVVWYSVVPGRLPEVLQLVEGRWRSRVTRRLIDRRLFLGDIEGEQLTDKPTVLFVCVHNAGRSQMAAGYLTALARGRVEVVSAGSEPTDVINPIAAQAMAEEGIDIAGSVPKLLTTGAVEESDVVITMGCGDTCPFFPGKRYEDWDLVDPAGKDIAVVREVRDEIKRRVEALVAELLPITE